MLAAGESRWGAPWCRATYSTQNTAVSIGDTGLSLIWADSFSMFCLYLEHSVVIFIWIHTKVSSVDFSCARSTTEWKLHTLTGLVMLTISYISDSKYNLSDIRHSQIINTQNLGAVRGQLGQERKWEWSAHSSCLPNFTCVSQILRILLKCYDKYLY